MKTLCIRCADEIHTNPKNASSLCTCGLRTCGCYGLQVLMGVRKDKRK